MSCGPTPRRLTPEGGAITRRDVERVRFLDRRYRPDDAAAQARAVVERVRQGAADLDPRIAFELGKAFADGERCVDAADVLEVGLVLLPTDDLGALATDLRLLLLGEAEEAGRFSVAARAGSTLLSTPTLPTSRRVDSLVLVAEVERQQGRWEASRFHLDEALAVGTGTDEDSWAEQAWIGTLYGVLAHDVGDLVAADGHFRSALSSTRLPSRPLTLALAADALVDAGDPNTAWSLLDEADVVCGGTNRSWMGTIGLVRSRVLRSVGRPDEALPWLDRAEVDLSVAQRVPLLARLQGERGRCQRDLGHPAQARDLLVGARDELAALGCVVAADRIAAELSA